tara:strand:- start:97 stop:678 length:582 start_codon:yes stop_codon:yes gene_type:complete
MACSAHKFHGPKGVGFLYVNKNININPLIHGGSQERNMRGGTENVYGIVGLSKAMDVSLNKLIKHRKHIVNLKKHMLYRLNKSIPGVSFNGDCENLSASLYTLLSVSLPPVEIASMILFNMDIMGVACSGGSACSSGANIGSHVLENLKTPIDRPTIRFSFSKMNTIQEIDFAVDSLVKLYSRFEAKQNIISV